MVEPYIRFDLEGFARDLSYELTHVANNTDSVHIFDK